MALSEFEIKKAEKEVSAFVEKRRPPPSIRNELDIGYRIKGQSVEIVDVRPLWRGKPGETIEHPVAKPRTLKHKKYGRFIGSVLISNGTGMSQIQRLIPFKSF